MLMCVGSWLSALVLIVSAMTLNEQPALRLRSRTGVLLALSTMLVIADSGMWAYWLLWSSVW